MAEVRLPEGLRWTCSGCGACCSAFRLGPVEPEIVDRLHGEDIGGRWAPAAEGFVDRERDGLFLRKVDGHCVFLRDDKLCAVHVLLGADAKPGFCREFPYHFVEDPRGLVAIIRATCKGFGRSSREGPLVTADDALASDVARNVPRRRFAPPHVDVAPGVRVALDRYMTVEGELLDRLAPERITDPEPSRWIAAIRDHVHPSAPPVRPEQARAAEEAILRALRIVMGQVVEQPGGTPEQRAFAAEALERVSRAHDGVGQPLALGPDEVAYANLLLRSYLLAKRFTAYGGLAEGLGAWLVGAIVARRTANHRGAEALGLAWREWERLEAVELVTVLLRRARPALLDLFLHA